MTRNICIFSLRRLRPSPLLVKHKHRLASNKSYDPLRILFCGSDEFSIASLRALDHARKADTAQVASLDVVCRPEKPVQRHLSSVREVPIAAVARELGLPLHKIDTFTGWTLDVTWVNAHLEKPPTRHEAPINLIVAVSFGLRVPARILGSVKYGGLNVHPSLLPEYVCPRSFLVEALNKAKFYRFPGPAPLHHTLLADRRTTGVTLQTLHPTKMDGGQILAQTPYPGIEHRAKTVTELQALTAQLGADMLIQSLKNAVFVPPIQEVGWYAGNSTSEDFTHATKIGPKERHLDWATWSADEILRRQRVIGPLWNTTKTSIQGNIGEWKEAKRIIWDDGFQRLEEECHLFPAVGQPIIVGLHGPAQKIYIRTCDGNVLVARRFKVEGGATAEAFQAAKRNGLAPIPKGIDTPTQLPHDFLAFHSPLT
ncbi:MAG: hypothetical protein Q9209_000204 [Squamulea sp. 1 TL-2023]